MVAGLVAIFLIAASTYASAVVINVEGGNWSGDLVCPEDSRSKPKPRKNSQGETQRIPDADEITDLPANSNDIAQSPIIWPAGMLPSGKPLRIGLWGDSHVAARFFSDEIIKSIGLSQDQVGQQFLPPTMGMSGVRLPLKNYCRGPGWKLRFSYREVALASQSSAGLAGLQSVESNSYLWLDVRSPVTASSDINGLDIVFSPLQTDQSALLAISVDDGAERLVSLTADNSEAVKVRADKPISVIKIRVIVGDVTIEGFLPNHVSPAMLYFDTLGIPGATIAGWGKIDAAAFRRTHRAQDYDIVMLEYGTNEGNVRVLDEIEYQNTLRNALANLKSAYPSAACVLIGAPDRGVLLKGKRSSKKRLDSANALHYSAIHSRINHIQQTLAGEYSCAFWNWQHAMGGNGSAYRWYYQSPALMSKDLIHLSIPGYQKSARMLEGWLGLRNIMPAAN